jgi:copper chaperone CopZ
MSKIIIPIEGMHCQHCVDSITGALSPLPGVKEVSVDLKKGEAAVSGDNLDLAAMRLAIEDIGFDVGEPK